MDSGGFRQYLQSRQLSETEIVQHIALAERFDVFVQGTSAPTLEDGKAFVASLVAGKADSYENILALARYGWFSQARPVYLAALELIDGGEVMNNIYKRLAQAAGEEVRNQVFAGIERPTWGTPNSEKPRCLQAVIERMEQLVHPAVREKLLTDCLRDLPTEYYLDDRRKYEEAVNFDAYLEQKRAEFIAQLEHIRDEGGLFFNQEITDEVIDFVRADPEISQGVRQKNILYVTKIPYLTKEYLAESDPAKKRYYACHCPWARESIMRDDLQVSPDFCQCSGGFHKKSWEVIFERPLKVDVLESALAGDLRCRFAIYLPEDIL